MITPYIVQADHHYLSSTRVTHKFSFILTREKRSARAHFRRKASTRPHVHPLPVSHGTCEHLRSSIPAASHVLRQSGRRERCGRPRTDRKRGARMGADGRESYRVSRDRDRGEISCLECSTPRTCHDQWTVHHTQSQFLTCRCESLRQDQPYRAHPTRDACAE